MVEEPGSGCRRPRHRALRRGRGKALSQREGAARAVGLPPEEHAPREGDARREGALPGDRRPLAPELDGEGREGRFHRREGDALDHRQGRAGDHGPQGRAHDGQPHRRHGRGARRDDRGLRQGAPRALPDLHRAVLRFLPRGALSAAPGRRHRDGRARRRARAQGPEDARPLPSRAAHRGAARQGGRQALRSDVGGLRRAPPAGLHSYRRPGGVLPADRLHERALGRARTPPRLVLLRERLPELPRADGGARSRLRTPPEDLVRGAARRPRRREPGVRRASRSTSSRT